MNSCKTKLPFLMLLLISAALIFTGCPTGGGDGDTEPEKTITLSGTVNVSVDAKLDGKLLPHEAYVFAYNGDKFVKSVRVEGNKWSMELTPFAADTTLTFRVSAAVANHNERKTTTVSRTVKDKSISNINLGQVSFNFGSFIELKGIVTAVNVSGTLNGTSLTSSDYEIYVYAKNDDHDVVGEARVENKNWAMIIKAYDTDTSLNFNVICKIGSMSIINEDNVNKEVKNTSITNINFDKTVDFNLALITLSGTANITVKGVKQNDNNWILASDDLTEFNNRRFMFHTELQSNDTWTMVIFAFETTVYFAVDYFDAEWKVIDTGVSKNVHDTKIEGITLSVNIP